MTRRRALSCEPSYSEVSSPPSWEALSSSFSVSPWTPPPCGQWPCFVHRPGTGWERRGVGLLRAAKTHVPVWSRQGGRTIPEVSFLTPQSRMIARIKSSLS